MEIKVILHNIRSSYNVGAILRTCDGFGVQEVFFSGYTPRVHDSSLLPYLREKLDHAIGKTALGAEDAIKIGVADDVNALLDGLKKDSWTILGLENNIKDERLFKLDDQCLKNKLGGKVVLLLGEEVKGIDTNLYPKIDYFAEIPMKGMKESFNVSVATAVALYELSKY